jgi:hypothetical protein
VGARKAQDIPQEVDEEQSGLDFVLVFRPIYRKADRNRHDH